MLLTDTLMRPLPEHSCIVGAVCAPSHSNKTPPIKVHSFVEEYQLMHPPSPPLIGNVHKGPALTLRLLGLTSVQVLPTSPAAHRAAAPVMILKHTFGQDVCGRLPLLALLMRGVAPHKGSTKLINMLLQQQCVACSRARWRPVLTLIITISANTTLIGT